MENKNVDFAEAFVAYEEGKEVKSLASTFKYKKIDGEDSVYSYLLEEWVYNELGFFLAEIRGKWCIKEQED